jgi:hypothetical protein
LSQATNGCFKKFKSIGQDLPANPYSQEAHLIHLTALEDAKKLCIKLAEEIDKLNALKKSDSIDNSKNISNLDEKTSGFNFS